MTISKLRKIYIVILIAIIAIMIVTIFRDPSDIKLLAKCASLIIAYIVAIVKLESWRNSFAGRNYELKYHDLIGDAFTNNKSARKQLIKGIILYNDGKYDAAVSKFDSLRKDCTRPADYSAILTFRALCFSERKGYDEAIATYKELLDHDPQNSRAWSNLGLCYTKSGRTDLAAGAYRNAIRANDKNAYAHTNYASLLLEMLAEDETTLAHYQAYYTDTVWKLYDTWDVWNESLQAYFPDADEDWNENVRAFFQMRTKRIGITQLKPRLCCRKACRFRQHRHGRNAFAGIWMRE